MPDHHHSAALTAGDLAVVVVVVLAAFGYLVADRRGRGRRSPWWRPVWWVAGLTAVTVATVGPLAEPAHHDFRAHAAGHVLLGMAGPLLLALARPVTVLLRAVPATTGRRVSRLLRTVGVRVVTEPVVAALLVVGGLALLYRTDLYAATHVSVPVHGVVHLHVLASGYLFAASVLAVDPLPHRRGHGHRAVVLVLALAAHDVLAKQVYASPPVGVDPAQGRSGAMIMYYGGDLVDLVLIVLLCRGWYLARAASDRRRALPVLPSR